MAKHHSTIKCGVLVYDPELDGVIILLADQEAQIHREYPRFQGPYVGDANLRSGDQNIDDEIHVANLVRKSQNDLRGPVARREVDTRAVNQRPDAPRDIDRMCRRSMAIRQKKLPRPSDRFQRPAGQMPEIWSDGTPNDRKGSLVRY